jgi:K+-sensing histidine kinase KdpD
MVRLHSILAFARGRFVRRCLIPALLVGVAVLLTMQVPDVQLHSFFSIFLGAVAVAAYTGGWQAGAIASVFSVIASDMFFLPPTWATAVRGSGMARVRAALQIDNPSDLVRLVAFAFTAFIICLLAALIERKDEALRGAKQFLTEQQHEMEFLKNTAKIWSWEYDLQTHRITWTNMYSLVVLRREEPLESWLESIHPDDRDRVKNALDRALVDGEFEAEYRILVENAEPRRIMGRAVLYSIGGHITGLRGIEIDRELRAAAASPSPV